MWLGEKATSSLRRGAPEKPPATNSVRSSSCDDPTLDQTSVARIISAAIAEFGNKGYEAARVDAIGLRAQTSKQLIYHYFGTKRALYVAAVEELCRGEHRWLLSEDFDHLSPFDAIERFLDLMLTTKLGNDHQFAADQVLNHSAHFSAKGVIGKLGRRCIGVLERILSRGRREGCFDPTISAGQLLLHMIVLSAGFSAFRGIMPQYIGQDFSSEDVEADWRVYALRSLKGVLLIVPDGDCQRRASDGPQSAVG